MAVGCRLRDTGTYGRARQDYDTRGRALFPEKRMVTTGQLGVPLAGARTGRLTVRPDLLAIYGPWAAGPVNPRLAVLSLWKYRARHTTFRA